MYYKSVDNHVESLNATTQISPDDVGFGIQSSVERNRQNLSRVSGSKSHKSTHEDYSKTYTYNYLPNLQIQAPCKTKITLSIFSVLPPHSTDISVGYRK